MKLSGNMIKGINIENLKKMYTWLVVLLPLLSVYGWSGLDIGTLSVFVVFFVLLIMSEKKLKANTYIIWYIYAGYIFIGEILFCFDTSPYYSTILVIFRTIKYLLYIFSLIVSVLNEFCNYDYMVKCYLKIVNLTTAYIIVQTITYYLFGIKLWGYANVFLYEQEYAIRLTTPVNGLFRPTSLFYEPAHYFEFVFFGVVFLLFSEEFSEKKVLISIYITIGIVLSTSGQGIVCTALVWGMWILRYLIKNGYKKKMPRIMVLVMLGGILATVIMIMSKPGQQIIERIVNPNVVGGNAIAGRMGSYFYLLDLSAREWLFGAGYGNILPGFFANWAYNIWCLGIVGTILVIIIYFCCYKRSYRTEVKLLVILNAILCLFNTLFMGKYLLFYFMFILCGNLYKKEERIV